MSPRDDGPDAEEITVCPECDGPWVHRRTRQLANHETAIPEYHCRACDAAFDEPDTRTRQQDRPPKGLPGALLDADPDEVGGDD